MRVLALDAQRTDQSAQHGHPRLTGTPLLLARSAWLLTVGLVVGLQAFSIPFAYAQMQQTYPLQHACPDTRYTVAQVAALNAAGISLRFFATWIVANQMVFLLFCVSVATLIFWRRSDEWMAIFSAISLVLWAVYGDNHQMGTACALQPHFPALAQVATVLSQLAGICLPLLFYLFPSGHWTPHWTRWMIIPWLAAAVVSVGSANLFVNHLSVGNVVEPVLLSTCIIAQVYRYLRVSNPEERRQTKWVVLGMVLGLTGFSVILAWGAFNGNYDPTSTRWPLDDFLSAPVIDTFLSVIPISIAIAILRSKLFDIDVLINRVLVYGPVTGLLALLYLVSVIVLQSLAQRITGQTSPLAIVVSTLAIAALFQPLRRNIRTAIDQRFYRHKYDAARTVSKFSELLQHEVDLKRLNEGLLTVVDETMRPAHLSLWLRSASHGEATSSKAPE